MEIPGESGPHELPASAHERPHAADRCIGEETPQELNWQRGLGAFHAVLAVGTYVLAAVIVRRAATAFRIKRPTTLYMVVSRLLKGKGVVSAPSDRGSGTRA